MFHKGVELELATKVRASLKRARTTILEYLLIDGCVLACHAATVSDGRNQIVEQMQAMQELPEPDEGLNTDSASFDPLTMEDVHAAIWKCAQHVAKGGQLTMNV